MKKIGLMVMALALMVVAAMAQESKYSAVVTGIGTDPAVTFSPKNGQQMVSSLQTSCDVPLGAVKFYTRAGKYLVTGTNSATEILITNPSASGGFVVTNSDKIVYCHANGTVDYDTVSSCSSTSVTMTTGYSIAWATGDYLYEVSQKHQIVVADSTAGVGTNKTANFQGDIFAVPGDSPVYITLDNSTNGCLSVTVK